MRRLTEAQRDALEKAERGGVIGFGPSRQRIAFLQSLGFLAQQKDEYGYFNITPAGRAKLAEERS